MLVNLNPRRSCLGKLGKNLSVGCNNVVKAFEGVVLRSCLVSLRDGKEGHGTNEYRANDGALFLRRDEAIDNGVISERNRRIGANFGNQVVVVRVEPLGHFQRCNLRVATSQGEVQIQPFEGTVALGNRAQKSDRIQNLVVECESFGDRRIIFAEAKLDEAVMSRLAELGFRRAELIGGDTARPVGFERLLQLAATTDARVTQDGRRRELSHLLILCHREMDGSTLACRNKACSIEHIECRSRFIEGIHVDSGSTRVMQVASKTTSDFDSHGIHFLW